MCLRMGLFDGALGEFMLLLSLDKGAKMKNTSTSKASDPQGTASQSTASQSTADQAIASHASASHSIHPTSGEFRKKNRMQHFLASTVGMARFIIECGVREKLLEVASSLTFTTVLAIVPLLAVALSLFTAFPLFGEFSLALQGFLAHHLMPTEISDTIMEHLNAFAAQASHLTAVGGLFLLVTALLLIMTIDSALNDLWHVHKQRPFLQRFLVYWAVISVGPVLMGASLWTTTYLARESMGLVTQMPVVIESAAYLLPFLLTGFGFTVLFLIVPNRSVEWKDAAAGGCLAALLLEVMKRGFAFYIAQFPTYAVIYGAFATVPVFLLWVYLSWLGVLVGALLSANLPAMRSGRWSIVSHASGDFLDALQIISELARVRGSRPAGISSRELASFVDLPQTSLSPILESLSDLGLVTNSYSGWGSERWVLACDLAQTPLSLLFDHMAMDKKLSQLKHQPELSNALSDLIRGVASPTLQEVIEHADTIRDPALQSNRVYCTKALNER